LAKSFDPKKHTRIKASTGKWVVPSNPVNLILDNIQLDDAFEENVIPALAHKHQTVRVQNLFVGTMESDVAKAVYLIPTPKHTRSKDATGMWVVPRNPINLLLDNTRTANANKKNINSALANKHSTVRNQSLFIGAAETDAAMAVKHLIPKSIRRSESRVRKLKYIWENNFDRAAVTAREIVISKLPHRAELDQGWLRAFCTKLPTRLGINWSSAIRHVELTPPFQNVRPRSGFIYLEDEAVPARGIACLELQSALREAGIYSARVRPGRSWRDRNRSRQEGMSKPPATLRPPARITGFLTRTPYLRIGTINVNSLIPKVVAISLLISRLQLDILAVQETRCSVMKSTTLVNNYEFIGRPNSVEPSTRGVGFFINRSIPFRVVETTSCVVAGLLWLRLKTMDGGILFLGSIYLAASLSPSEKRKAVRGMGKQMVELKKMGRIILMGDLNALVKVNDGGLATYSDTGRECTELNQLVVENSLHSIFGRTDSVCSPLTYHRNGLPFSTLDYILLDKDLIGTLGADMGIDSADTTSDHYPVYCSLNLGKLKVPFRPRIDTKWVRTSVDELSKKFECLSKFTEDDDTLGPVEAMECFESELISCCKQTTQSKRKLPFISKETRKRLRNERTMFKKLKANQVMSLESDKSEWAAFTSAKANTKQMVRYGKQFNSHLKVNTALVDRKMNPAEYWRFLKLRGMNCSGAGIRLGDVLDERGRVCSTVDPQYAEVVRSYFQKLGNTDYPLIQTPQDIRETQARITNLVKANFGAGSIGVATATVLDLPFTKSEVGAFIKLCKNGKAPGLDGLPIEVFKVLGTGGLMRLTQCFNGILEAGSTPRHWGEAAICLLPKKGDLLALGNWRGISLLAVAAKIYLGLLAKRLSAYCEANDLLSDAQAGFRPGRSCVDQHFALLEILKRRRIKGLKTYCAFVDIRKAFDRVWRDLLWLTLAELGCSAKFLNTIRSIYDSSVGRIRLNDSKFTEDFPLLWGVRQGCPLSPLMFVIFINGILDKMSRVHVPGLISGAVAGLLFADDLVLIADSYQQLQLNLDLLTRWATLHKLDFGFGKSKSMSLVIPTSSELIDEGNGKPRVVEQTLSLSGKDLPKGDDYTYLGLPITRNLSVEAMIADRKAKTTSAVNANFAILTNRKLPIGMKLDIVRAVIVPVATYGSIIWGSSEYKMVTLQAMVNRAIKLAMGTAANPTNEALWRESSVTPIYYRCRRAQTKALYKWCNSATFSRSIIKRLIDSSQGAGVSGSQFILMRSNLKRCGIETDELMRDATRKVLQDNLSKLSDHFFRRRELSALGKPTLLDYLQGLPDPTWLNPVPSEIYSGAIPEHLWLTTPLAAARLASHMRMGCFPSTRILALAHRIDSAYLEKCALCQAPGAEDLIHFLKDCKFLTVERSLLLEYYTEIPENIIQASNVPLTNNTRLSTLPCPVTRKCWLLMGVANFPVTNRERKLLGEAWLTKGILGIAKMLRKRETKLAALKEEFALEHQQRVPGDEQ
jgi:exonuclease III